MAKGGPNFREFTVSLFSYVFSTITSLFSLDAHTKMFSGLGFVVLARFILAKYDPYFAKWHPTIDLG